MEARDLSRPPAGPSHRGHSCCLYQTEDERRATVGLFLKKGLEQGDKVVYAANARSADGVFEYLGGSGVDVRSYLSSGQLSVLSHDETFLLGGTFSPERMVALLRTEKDKANSEGYAQLRGAGDMSWALGRPADSERLIECEAMVDPLLNVPGCLAMCCYDQRQFDLCTLHGVLATHPRIFLGSKTFGNPCYVPPGQLLSPRSGDATLRKMLEAIAEREQLLAEVASLKRTDARRAAEFDQLRWDFLSLATHEFNTPLTIIKGYAQALLRIARDDHGRRLIQAINMGADRLAKTVKDAVTALSLDSGDLELATQEFDLRELVEHVTQRLALSSTRHRIRLAKAAQVVVRADASLVDQVLTNLIDNAVRYSPEGGDIEVELAERGQEAILSVRDHGIGIPKDRQAGIFQRFHRAHADKLHNRSGLALGLFVSMEIIRRHGGRMWFESEERRGTTFHFSLPLVNNTSSEM